MAPTLIQRLLDAIKNRLDSEKTSNMKFETDSRQMDEQINCRPATGTIFELIQDIININGLTKFHEEWTVTFFTKIIRRKNALPPGGHVFQPTGTISNSTIISTNILTKFYENLKIN
ncbi:hypothetical protein DPMN_099027 [Dreissena polymorpha]|uniref:Uncharacterized protein n=1 Tax=Dreissena polymorpha TaxID=45954 RepID=A0A9D4R676_DREPO|nr:hypothetical protein DPMN_099027 [Dreissena polymorpha]